MRHSAIEEITDGYSLEQWEILLPHVARGSLKLCKRGFWVLGRLLQEGGALRHSYGVHVHSKVHCPCSGGVNVPSLARNARNVPNFKSILQTHNNWTKTVLEEAGVNSIKASYDSKISEP